MATDLRTLARFYLEGREDAGNDFSPDDFEPSAIAIRVVAGDNLHEACKKAVADEIATDAHDGTKGKWMEAESARLAGGVDREAAYAAWCTGYIDKASGMLEDEVESAVWDALEDEDTAVETPAGRARTASNPVGDEPSYGAWFESGSTDAASSWDPTELDEELRDAIAGYRKRPSYGVTKWAEAAVDAYWKVIGDDAREQWMADHKATARADGLDAKRAYKSWEDGMRTTYVKYASKAILERAAA